MGERKMRGEATGWRFGEEEEERRREDFLSILIYVSLLTSSLFNTDY